MHFIKVVAFVFDCCKQMPFVTKQPPYNVLYELIVRTINAVKELDSIQAERFQRKIRFALQEPNGEASDVAIASAAPEEVSTGDESAVCLADTKIMFNGGVCGLVHLIFILFVFLFYVVEKLI